MFHYKFFLKIPITCLLVVSLISCEQEDTLIDTESGQCINGPCNVEVIPDPVGQPSANQDDNGYWHL